MMQQTTVAPSQEKRVLILSDVTNEADDPFAIAHAVLSPSLDVRGIVATHYVQPGSTAESYAEAVALANTLGIQDTVPVVPGATGPLDTLTLNAPPSDGARLLVNEALREDARPLYVLVLGALTEVAEALTTAPEIECRFTLIWVGGESYPAGGREANLTHDLDAARAVFASRVAIWQITCSGYREMICPLSWLAREVAPLGTLGQRLYRRVVDFSTANADKPWVLPECWVLGDNTAVGVLLADHWHAHEERPAPAIDENGTYLPGNGRTIRVYEHVNHRFILNDMVAKLAAFADGREG